MPQASPGITVRRTRNPAALHPLKSHGPRADTPYCLRLALDVQQTFDTARDIWRFFV
jgi:hypothetical protein